MPYPAPPYPVMPNHALPPPTMLHHARPCPTMSAHAQPRTAMPSEKGARQGSAGLPSQPNHALPCPLLGSARLCRTCFGAAHKSQRTFSSEPFNFLGTPKVGKQKTSWRSQPILRAPAALARFSSPSGLAQGPTALCRALRGSGPPGLALDPPPWPKSSRPIQRTCHVCKGCSRA